MNLARENAVYFQRDFFSDSGSIGGLFKRCTYARLADRFDDTALFDQFATGQYDRLVISNPYRDALSRTVYRQAKVLGIPLLIVERGAVPGAVFLDTTGFLFDSDLYDRRHWDTPLGDGEREHLERFKRCFVSSAHALEFQPQRQAADKVRERLSAGGRRICAITLQMPSDAVVRNFHDPDCDYDRFMREIEAVVAGGKQGWRFAVKSHPRAPLSSIGGAAAVNDININDLIAAADAVVTFNSGTGVSAMLHDKPVGCFGRAFYGGAGLTTTLHGRSDLDRFLDEPWREIDKESHDRFLWHLLFRVYSEFKFLGPFPGSSGFKTVAMTPRTIRLFDPRNGDVHCLVESKNRFSFLIACQYERLRAWRRAWLNFLERRGDL